MARLPAELLLGSHALYAFLSFTVHDVLLKYAQRPAEDPEEPACMLCRALAVLTRCVQTLADSVATLAPDRLRASCVLSLVAELLSASPLTERVLAVQAVPLSLCRSARRRPPALSRVTHIHHIHCIDCIYHIHHNRIHHIDRINYINGLGLVVGRGGGAGAAGWCWRCCSSPRPPSPRAHPAAARRRAELGDAAGAAAAGAT